MASYEFGRKVFELANRHGIESYGLLNELTRRMEANGYGKATGRTHVREQLSGALQRKRSFKAVNPAMYSWHREGSGARRGGTLGALHGEREDPIDREPLRQREQVRGTVTYMLMVIFALTLLGGYIAAMYGGEGWTNTQDWLQTAIPAITGLLGSAMGFYFGRLR